MSSVHDFTAQTIHGQAADLADYAGKTLLVVQRGQRVRPDPAIRRPRRHCIANTPTKD